MSMVEWKKLSDVAVIKNGKDYKKLSNGNIPVFGTGGIMTYVDQFASDKPSVLLPRKGSIENIFYVDEPFWTVDTLYWTDIDTSKIDPKFLFVSLQRYNLKEFAYGGARPSLSQQILYNLDIPLPSLSEQKRIVGILDTFTASIDNLKEQIAQRRKQYEYYRDQLLDLEGKEGVEMKKLSCIAEIGTGSSNTQDELEKGKYPFFVRSQVVRWKNEFEFDETAIITSGDGVGVGKVLHYYEGKYALHQRAYRIHINVENIVPKFLYYFMQKDFYNYIMSNAYAASVTSVRKPMLLNYPIPVPSLQEQQRIVSILDTFEASIQNLEAQLSQREKQYEYYRNKLLTFE